MSENAYQAYLEHGSVEDLEPDDFDDDEPDADD